MSTTCLGPTRQGRRIEDLDALLSEKMRQIEGVTLTSTMIVAKYKY
jgi:DNA-binding Lrp family transcriptional regulator